MLMLKRAPGQSIRIGEHIVVTVTSVADNRVVLGIEAPRDVAILRDDAIQQQPREKQCTR